MSHTKLQMSPWFELMRRTIGGKPVIWLPRPSEVATALQCVAAPFRLHLHSVVTTARRLIAGLRLRARSRSSSSPCFVCSQAVPRRRKELFKSDDGRLMHSEAHTTGLKRGEPTVFGLERPLTGHRRRLFTLLSAR